MEKKYVEKTKEEENLSPEDFYKNFTFEENEKQRNLNIKGIVLSNFIEKKEWIIKKKKKQ